MLMFQVLLFIERKVRLVSFQRSVSAMLSRLVRGLALRSGGLPRFRGGRANLHSVLYSYGVAFDYVASKGFSEIRGQLRGRL